MIHDHRFLKYRKITFSLPGNLMDCVKKGIVRYVLQKMDKGQALSDVGLPPYRSTSAPYL